MIGTRAFLLQLPLLVLPLIALLGLAALMVRSRRRQLTVPTRTGAKVRGAAAVLILVILAISGGFRLARQMQYHSALRDLQTDSIDWMQVGNARLEKESDLITVAGLLQNSEWYEPTAGDGGRGRAVDLIIHFKTGNEQRYLVARHLRYRGAVIAFIGQRRNSGIIAHYGYALAEDLPDTLDRLGVHLPTDDRAAS